MNRLERWPRLSSPDLAVQFVVLVAGVLLALAVDEWRAGQANARLTEAVLRSMGRELADNRAVVARRLPYHAALRDSLARDFEAATARDASGLRLRPGVHLRPPAAMGFTRGFATTGLAATAWQTAVAANVLGFLDYPTTTVLARAYATQAEVTATADGLSAAFPLILGGYYAGTAPVTASLVAQAALTDLVLREREALTQYDAALAHLRRRAGTSGRDADARHPVPNGARQPTGRGEHQG